MQYCSNLPFVSNNDGFYPLHFKTSCPQTSSLDSQEKNQSDVTFLSTVLALEDPQPSPSHCSPLWSFPTQLLPNEEQESIKERKRIKYSVLSSIPAHHEPVLSISLSLMTAEVGAKSSTPIQVLSEVNQGWAQVMFLSLCACGSAEGAGTGSLHTLQLPGLYPRLSTHPKAWCLIPAVLSTQIWLCFPLWRLEEHAQQRHHDACSQLSSCQT